jgi:hypothetical protein
MGQCCDRFFLAKSASHAVVEGRQVIVFGMGNGPGDFIQDGPQVGIPFSCLATEPLPPALLVAWADTSPRGNMFVRSKAGHIGANFSDDPSCCYLGNTYDALH